MCLAIPGKIIELHDQQATADFDGVKKEVNVSLVDVAVGDFVIVHAGFAIEKYDATTVEDIQRDLRKK